MSHFGSSRPGYLKRACALLMREKSVAAVFGIKH
jgi:hypothetical protein